MKTKIRTLFAILSTWTVKIILLLTETIPFGFLLFRWGQLLIESLEEDIVLHQWLIFPYLVMPMIGVLNFVLSLLGVGFSFFYVNLRTRKRNRIFFIVTLILSVLQTFLSMAMFAIF